jgi:[NiFe] hydrogenase large subunit
MAAAHYIEALRLQARTARMHAVFGGKNPHPQFLVVGGITSVADLKPDRIAEFLYLQKETQEFIENVYIPDLVAVASFYKEWGAIGGTTNFLAWGEFPEGDNEPDSLFMPRGVIKKRDLANIPVAVQEHVTENVTRAWYEDGADLHPYEGETKPLQEDPKYRPDSGKYSWFKAPRYEGEPCEVGPWPACWWPTARATKPIKPLVDSTLQKLGIPAGALFSTLGRTAARGLETIAIGQAMPGWTMELLENIKNGDTQTYTALGNAR